MADLVDRKVSGFPLSISTALAFESLFQARQEVYDKEREAPPMIDISPYTELWINMATLYRNLLQACDKEVAKNAGHKEVAEVLIEEMEIIESLLQHEGQGRMKAVFYTADHMEKLKPYVKKGLGIREDKSLGDLHYTDVFVKSIKEISKTFPGKIREFKHGIKTSIEAQPSVLMLTNIPFDLTYYKSFSRLDLLESNTGKLKKRSQWNSKYYPLPNLDMRIFPFYQHLLCLFGDKTTIVPMGIKLRRSVHEIAVKGKWTAATTREKVDLDISLGLNPFDYACLMAMA